MYFFLYYLLFLFCVLTFRFYSEQMLLSIFKLVFIFRAVFTELQFEVFAERKIFTMTIWGIIRKLVENGFQSGRRRLKNIIFFNE